MLIDRLPDELRWPAAWYRDYAGTQPCRCLRCRVVDWTMSQLGYIAVPDMEAPMRPALGIDPGSDGTGVVVHLPPRVVNADAAVWWYGFAVGVATAFVGIRWARRRA
jgi:hypothetical protein